MTEVPEFLPGLERVEMPTTEDFKVHLGDHAKRYGQEAKKLGISEEGAFIISAFAHMLSSQEAYDGLVSTACDEVCKLADDIEVNGVDPGADSTRVANLLRYLGQFLFKEEADPDNMKRQPLSSLLRSAATTAKSSARGGLKFPSVVLEKISCNIQNDGFCRRM